MKLLAAHQIRPELLDLISSARKYLVLVSPSLKIDRWAELVTELKHARQRGVRIEAFTGDKLISPGRLTQLANLDIHPYPVDGLQTAFCYTEASGLISSFNLLGTHPGIAIHIGCKIELTAELKELKGYVRQYVKPSDLIPSEQPAPLPKRLGYLNSEMFAEDLQDYISQYTRWPVAVSIMRGDSYVMQINGQQFDVYNAKATRQIVLYAHVVGAEITEYHERGEEFYSSALFEYSISLNGDGSEGAVVGFYNIFLSRANPARLPDKEKIKMLHAFVTFIKSTQALKEAAGASAHRAD